VPQPSSRRKGGDGRLTAAIDPHDQGPQDACGVFGVWAPGEDVAKLTYFGLYALQHRGQESAGIAVSNGRQILVYKDMGLVSQVFDESTLESLKGHVAVAECCLAGGIGATLDLGPSDAPIVRLFGEGAGGFVVSGPREALDDLATRVPVNVLGQVGGDALWVSIADRSLSLPLDELRRAHAALERLFP
jgi:hypothetical protein